MDLSEILDNLIEISSLAGSEILDVSSVVSEIIKNVRERGDAAVIEYTSKLDRNNEIQLEVSNDSIEEYIKEKFINSYYSRINKFFFDIFFNFFCSFSNK